MSRAMLCALLALAACAIGWGALVWRAYAVTSRPLPPPPPAACPTPAPPDELQELATLIELARATSLPHRLACSLPCDDGDAEACQTALARAEVQLGVAEGAVRLGAVGVARQQLPAVRALVLGRGLAAPAGSR